MCLEKVMRFWTGLYWSVLVCGGLWGSVGIRGGLWRSVIQLSNMDPGK